MNATPRYNAVVRFCPLLLAAVLLAPLSAEEVGRGAYPDIAVDADRGVHVVYVRDGELRYRSKPEGAEWSEEESTGLPAGMAHRSDPEIVIDSGGRPHALVGSSYGRREESGWRRINPPDVVRDTSLAIDSRDNVYLTRRGGASGGFLGVLKLDPGADEFIVLPDPDTASGMPQGRNDHVYGHVATGPGGEVHVVYRHGSPQKLAYRVSSDGGRSWQGEGIAEDDREAPSAYVAPDGVVYVVGGRGDVFRREAGPGEWSHLGRAFETERRSLPVLVVDSRERVFVGGFGGKVNVREPGGAWRQAGELPTVDDEPVGYVDLALGPDDAVWAAWEIGPHVATEEPAGESRIFVDALQSSSASPAAWQVGLYEIFEHTLRSERAYDDPFRDVTLEGTFRGPDGKNTELEGFYDGEGRWRVRFMPTHSGTWNWSVGLSDGSASAAGTFECVASDTPGMLDSYPFNPMWFGYSSGANELIRGLHIGDRFFAQNWEHENRQAFLDWTNENDYNLLSIASHYLNRAEPGRGEGWETPDLWPLNPAEYRKMEAILSELARRRILVFPFAGFFGQDSDYPRDADDQELYVRYTLARLGAYWNVLFNVAGPEPNLRGDKRWMSDAEVERLGRLIRELDVYGHAVSVHNRTGDDPFRDSNWTTYGVLQGPKTVDLGELSEGLLESHHPRKPLLAQETLWSGNMYHTRNVGRDYSDDELRRNAIVMTMSAAAIVFADNDGNSSSGFSGTLDVDVARQQRHDILRGVWDIFERLPFYRMKPAQDLVDAGYALSDPGRGYLVYLPQGGRVNVELTGGPYRTEWINARDGSDRRDGPSTEDGRDLAAPDDSDWLLYLHR